MRISVDPFGTLPSGEEVLVYTLENNNGMRVQVLNFGGVIHSIEVPDKQGNLDDVVLGYDALADYAQNTTYFGAAVGRNSNRISGAQLHILEDTFVLEKNNGEHNLHGGSQGLSFRLFSSEVHTFNHLPVLLLNCTVPDLSDGFPGTLTVNLIYALTDDNALMLDYRAVSDKDTVINLTNHSYFNLAGHASGPIYGHLLQLEAEFYTPGDNTCVPTGEILQVKGTPFDFFSPRQLGSDIGSSYPQVQQYGGYDHNFVLNGTGYRRIATVREPESGRVMNVFTDLPGVQLYTTNSMDTSRTYKNGANYARHQGFCMETQFFPNAVNTPWFPSCVFLAGEEFATTTTYQFSLE